MKWIVRSLVPFFLLLCGAVPSAAPPGQPAAPQEKDVRVFGQRIHYIESGSSGPVVILLHGLGGNATHWGATLPALGAFHVFVPDQIGFGKSDKPLLNYRIATMVDFLDEFCRQAGIAKADVVGNSLGGWIAAAFALAHPERVGKLVLVDAAGYSSKRLSGPVRTRESLGVLNPSTLAGYKQLFNLIFFNKQLITDEFVTRVFSEKMAIGDGLTINMFIESILRDEDVLDGRLGAIKSPTLVVWGRGDGLIPPLVADAFAQDVPGAQKIVIDECGHAPQMECAAAFNKTLLTFLNGRAASTTSRH